MNKWQKVISQIAKEDLLRSPKGNRNIKRIVRKTIKLHGFTFEGIVKYKRYIKNVRRIFNE